MNRASEFPRYPSEINHDQSYTSLFAPLAPTPGSPSSAQAD